MRTAILKLGSYIAYFKQDEKKRKLLRVRLEMAKFLQETLRESGIKGGKSIIGTDEFKAFFYKVFPFNFLPLLMP
jgi:hypothetical protein